MLGNSFLEIGGVTCTVYNISHYWPREQKNEQQNNAARSGDVRHHPQRVLGENVEFPIRLWSRSSKHPRT